MGRWLDGWVDGWQGQLLELSLRIFTGRNVEARARDRYSGFKEHKYPS